MITRARVRMWWPWLAVVVAMLLVGVAGGAPKPDGPSLDPSSTGPSGTKALVDTLRLLGADVSVQSGAPGPADATALLLQDGFDDVTRGQVADWVRAGGTLVVTDVSSPLSPVVPSRPTELVFLDPELRRDCNVAALRQVQRLDVPGAVLQEIPDGATGCFRAGTDDEAFLVVVPVGDGTIVALGGAGFLVNGNLDEADNGLLAVSLLAPTGSERVVVLRPPAPGEGEKGLLDLVSRRWELAVLQLGVAFGVLVLWRSRRLGPPVLEPQPVQLAGSELVVAVGELLQRAKGREQAATVLRDDLRRWLAERVGLPPATPAEVVAEAVGASAGSDLRAEEVLAVLAGGRPADEDGLVALAHAVESIRRRVRGAE
ncbi:MAG: hypothetical protein QOH36_248 [Actinomycetota bacterium]|nr:hypothetical protein [Actinomycetota bacterium]